MNKKQIIFIGGANSFEKEEDFLEYLRTIPIDLNEENEERKRWKDWLKGELIEQYDFLSIDMPNRDWANYTAWKVWFERYMDFIHDQNPILIGYSQGAMFFLKYLSENKFTKSIKQLHLVAPAVTDLYEMGLEKLGTFNLDLSKINTILDFCGEVHLWHSEDDPTVPFANSKLIVDNMPSIKFHKFTNRGHFFDPTFPEILEVIKEAK
jgi:predicted alpha/beta hydrolase family esterase